MMKVPTPKPPAPEPPTSGALWGLSGGGGGGRGIEFELK